MADYTLSAKLTADESDLKKGFASAQKSLGDLQKNSSKIGKGLQDIGKKVSKVGDSLTRKITLPATAAVTALTGITLVKGFQRLTGIDTAQAKLKGLGHDAEAVEDIMTSALDSVRGTAHGMDEAATSAAGAVAAGVKPGKELTRYLTITGDAAAIAGSSMGEMGSIFGKVQTAQKAYTGELNQLADRGIPIFQWLADEAGTSAEAVRDMASNGAISSDMFLQAIENNIGGAAKTMGEESITAGFANIGAAIGRIGANFLDAGGKGGGFFSTVKGYIPDVIGYIDGLASKAEEMGQKFGNAIGSFIGWVTDLKNRFDNLDPSVQSFILKATAIGAAVAVGIGPALKIIGPLISLVGLLTKSFGMLSGAIGFLVSPVGLIVVAIGLLVGAFLYLWNTNEEFRLSMIEIWENISMVVMGAVDAVVGFVTMMWDMLVALWDEYGATIMNTAMEIWTAVYDTVMGLVTQVVDFVVNIWTMLVDFWNEHGQMIVDAAINVWTFLQPFIETYMTMIWENIKTIFTFIKNFIQNTWNMISGIFEGALNVIMGIVQFFGALFTGNWKGMWDAVKRIFGGALDIVKSIVGGVFGQIQNVINTVMGLIQNKISAVWEAVSKATAKVWDGMVGIIKAPINTIIGLINAMIGGINAIKIESPKIPSWVPKFGGKSFSIGFNIPKIPQLQHGTDDWIGGFARMNEGGRGELVHLPDGTQVIPHDISMRYAREAGRANFGSEVDQSVSNVTNYFTLDTSNVHEFNRVIEVFKGLKQTVRQG